MIVRRTIWVLLIAVLAAASCHSNLQVEQTADFQLEALFGTNQELTSFETMNLAASLTVSSLELSGNFYRISKPADFKLQSHDDTVDSDILKLIVDTPEFVDIGLVPLGDSLKKTIRINFVFEPEYKHTSSPPVGRQNKVEYFTAYQADAHRVFPRETRLEWAEVNTGDYNFDGEVNVADLVPLAVYFGGEIDTTDPESLRRTAYWVDGDNNGEINTGDITPIAANYLSTIDGYVVYRSGSALHHPDGSTATIKRSEAISRPSPLNPLPPFYSVLLDGQVEDDWALAPVDAQSVIGSISTVPPDRINEFEAGGSLVISGVELYNLLDEEFGIHDSGYSLLRVILPIDDIDGIHVGDIIEGANGLFSLANVPRDTQLALEVSYAPVLNLRTGAPFDSEDEERNRQLALANMVTTRFPFTLPSETASITMEPRINIALRTPGQQSSGYNIDLEVDTSWDDDDFRTVTRLDLFNGLVAVDSISGTDFSKRPWLVDSNFDCISDAWIRELNDINDHEGLGSQPVFYSGTVTAFNEATGMLTISNPFDIDLGMFTPQSEILFGFTEYTEMTDEVVPEFFTPQGLPGSVVQLRGYVLGGTPDGPQISFWGNSVNRTSI